jgi:hypothetical protein
MERINIILPEHTVRAIDRLSRPRERSRFIQRAVEHYINTQSPEAIVERLKHTALRDQDLDQEIANDWSIVDQESWQQFEQQEKQVKAIPKGAKSTSRRSRRLSGQRFKRPGQH